MSKQWSPIVGSSTKGLGTTFSVKSLNLHELGDRASPLVVLDNFRVLGHPFGPHPHAGFSAVTYVLEDSPVALRSRDSLGNDIVMGPGGIVWTQAGSGMLHDELPAEPGRELHGLQVFVNLSSKSKLLAPCVLKLARSQMPEWRSDGGDRVRIVAGAFEGLSSPLVPAEPFDWLDVALKREITFEVRRGRNALVYVLSGNVSVHHNESSRSLAAKEALALGDDAGAIIFRASQPAHLLILSGLRIQEPALSQGSGFIMSSPAELDAALVRFLSGQMGHLAPLADSVHP
jgi:redox-sensitive bicupin YhaK (pirin superfamily)